MFVVYGCVMSSILFSVHCHCLSTDIKAIDSVGDPPLPIPNREVKPDSADGTANVCGRVGHRHFYKREFQEIGTLFFGSTKNSEGFHFYAYNFASLKRGNYLYIIPLNSSSILRFFAPLLFAPE